MFIQDCFIKVHTPELREYLKDLGYKVLNFKNAPYLVRDDGYDGQEEFQDSYEIKSYSDQIDCGENIELFKAIAALRNDSDYMQWFVTDADQAWVNQGMYAPKGSFELCLTKDRYNGQDERLSSRVIPAHKATVEELIEHFK